MPLLEQIADMAPDVMETFTPPSIGGDTDLAEAKARIGDRVCMIGGFDQWRHFQGCTPEETRRLRMRRAPASTADTHLSLSRFSSVVLFVSPLGSSR